MADRLISPAIPAALLLYGIVFGFAIFSYIGWPWLLSETTFLYLGIFAWSLVAIITQWKMRGFSINRIDVLFLVFLLLVLVSAVFHWWEGTIKYFQYIPFFFILPYLLGRMMLDKDVLLFRKTLIGLGSGLLLLMLMDYFRRANSPSPFLFEQSHGAMLSGLVLSGTLLALLSMLILPAASNIGSSVYERRFSLIGYTMLALVASAMVWISSRGSAIAAVVGMATLLIFCSFCGWKKKILILLYVGLFVLMASMYSFQNKYNQEYYQQLFQRPSVALNVGGGDEASQAGRLEYGKPILGEKTCSNIADSVSDRWIHYQSAWKMFLEKPLTGVGANSYGFYSCAGPGWYPHSTILQVLAELGVLGGLVYLALIWMAFRALITRYSSSVDTLSRVNMGWALAFVVLQITTNQFYGNYFMSAGFYFVVGLAASFLGLVKKTREGA